MSKITNFLKTSTVILGISSFGFMTTAQAWADGRYNDRHHKEYRHDNRGKYNKHHNYKPKNYYHNKHYKPYRYNYVNYHYNHPRPRYHTRYHSHGSDVAIGILAGGLLAYGVTQAAKSNNRTEVIYVPAAQPAPAGGQGWAASPPPQQVAYTHSSCLQEREYQTTITVGNEAVPAYGTACLQPDGSWKFGPAQQVPAYAR